jgi:opacity protein-like surface antigen
MRKHLGLVAVLFFCAGIPLLAQDVQPFEFSAGYSYVHANQIGTGGCCFSMQGGTGGVAVNLSRAVGLVGEIGGYQSSNVNSTGLDLNVVTYLFGPRVSYRRGNRIVPFAEALFGGGHASGSLYGGSTSTGGGSQNAFALATGGGLDANFSRHVTLRLIQADYLLTRFKNGSNDHQNSFRIGAGLVFTFGSR